MKRTDQWLHENREALTASLQALIRIPSVKGEPAPGAPFGPAIKAVSYTHLLHVVEHDDLIGIGLEIGPDIVMERNDNLGPQGLGHAQNIAGGHLVGNPPGIFAKGN